MSLTYSTAVKNARLDAIEVTISTDPLLRLYNGTPPANADAALAGNTLLAQGVLPSDWMSPAADGEKVKSGTWPVTGQSGAGTGTPATFFRIYEAAGTTCHMQGTVTAVGDGGVMTLDNNSIANAQVVMVNAFQIVSAN